MKVPKAHGKCWNENRKVQHIKEKFPFFPISPQLSFNQLFTHSSKNALYLLCARKCAKRWA